MFSSTQGVETLLHCLEQFDRAASRLSFTNPEKWDYVSDILDPMANDRWKNQVSGLLATQKTATRLPKEIRNFVQSYAGHVDPRDVLIKHIESRECKKSRAVDANTHTTRIETLCKLANKLEGQCDELTEANIKQKIFESFPDLWQDDFKKSE